MYTFLMLLLSCSLASAVDWWVEDLDEAVEVTLALEQHWPDADVHVLVGPAGEQGIWYDEGRLHLVTEGATRSEIVSPDLGTQVLLVRSWTAELDTPDSGWLPDPRLDVVPPLPDVELADAERSAFRVGVTGGPGLPGQGPPVRLAGELGLRARSLGVAGVVLADLNEEIDLDGVPTWTGRRVGVGGQAGWYRRLPHGAIEPALVVQTRFLRYADAAGEEVLSLVLPGATARLRWWGEPIDAVAVGIGLAMTVEGTVFLADQAFRVGGDALYFEPVTAQLEFHLARELRR